jgi:hypothetical protein
MHGSFGPIESLGYLSSALAIFKTLFEYHASPWRQSLNTLPQGLAKNVCRLTDLRYFFVHKSGYVLTQSNSTLELPLAELQNFQTGNTKRPMCKTFCGLVRIELLPKRGPHLLDNIVTVCSGRNMRSNIDVDLALAAGVERYKPVRPRILAHVRYTVIPFQKVWPMFRRRARRCRWFRVSMNGDLPPIIPRDCGISQQ